jgi:uncharacterized protein with PIN domain
MEKKEEIQQQQPSYTTCPKCGQRISGSQQEAVEHDKRCNQKMVLNEVLPPHPDLLNG